MRTSIWSIQQALTAEAATIVKQALALARRRRHAQVTPLHVASAMLASSNSLLKRACFQCHSHPLQCKALELCFNVSLNRLAPSASNQYSSHPSLSNALVAAFKRAAAHQRRGPVEAVLGLKMEAEHVVVSILDDPSVSRVMREAGFSSTQIKDMVEKVVSLETSLTTQLPKDTNKPLDHPVRTLSLSLSLNSGSHANWAAEKHLTCCTDCSVNFDREAQSLTSVLHNKVTSTSSNLPCWLQKYKEERRGSSIDNKECVSVMDLCKKWNSICSTSHKHQTIHSPHEHDLKFHSTTLNWPALVEPKPELLSNPNSSPNSASSSEAMEDLDAPDHDKLKEFTAENVTSLCNALEAKVPHRKGAIREIVSTVLQCRSGKSKIMNKTECIYCQKGTRKRIESCGETHVPLKDGIVIFSCESYAPRKLQKCGDHDHSTLDLNIGIDQDEEDSGGDNIGILEYVGKVVTFKVQEL